MQALEKALLAYHTTKMQDINKVIKELWQKTYRNQVGTQRLRHAALRASQASSGHVTKVYSAHRESAFVLVPLPSVESNPRSHILKLVSRAHQHVATTGIAACHSAAHSHAYTCSPRWWRLRIAVQSQSWPPCCCRT